jgi:hypothetical protein
MFEDQAVVPGRRSGFSIPTDSEEIPMREDQFADETIELLPARLTMGVLRVPGPGGNYHQGGGGSQGGGYHQGGGGSQGDGGSQGGGSHSGSGSQGGGYGNPHTPYNPTGNPHTPYNPTGNPH